VLVVNEDVKKPVSDPSVCRVLIPSWVLDAITLTHLPNGPTAYFKLTSIELSKRTSVGPFKTPFAEGNR